jgi:RNA polymerase sigma-B factor
MQDLAVNVARVSDELSGHRSPATAAQIAARLDVSVEAIVEAREAYHAMRCESLDRPHRNGDDEGASLLVTIAGPDGDFARVRDRVTLETLLEALEHREHLVVPLLPAQPDAG